MTHDPATQPALAQTLWVDPGFGASGDMLLGALAGQLAINSGDPSIVDESLAPLDQLGLEPFELRLEEAIRCGLAAHRMRVATAPSGHGRTWSAIDQLLADALLPERAKAGARSTFRRLGEIEAAQHGIDVDEVHFHEVGAVDSILDIVGVWLLLDAINPTSVAVGPVGLGYGSVQAAHGLLPLPAPATVALLEGVPVRGLNIEGETCTPTGAALLVTVADAFGPLPDGVVGATTRGAGGRDPATHPNVVTITAIAAEDTGAGNSAENMGDVAPSAQGRSGAGSVDEPAWIIECNIDDTTPEVLASALDRLLDAGANDAWIVPIVMKKGRAAAQLRVLSDASHHRALVAMVFTETGTLGCRTIPATKHVLPRRFDTVVVRGREIDMKIGPHSAKPEHDHLASLADETGLPIRQLDLEARLVWEQLRSET